MFLHYFSYTLFLFLISTPLMPFSFFRNKPHPVTIMLDPAGDAHHVGRKLGDSFERSVTLHYVERLKTTLEHMYPHVRVVITRLPGEVEQPLQHANFANRLNTDLYIRINFYQEQSSKSHWYIYSFSYGDDFMIPPSTLTFYTYDKAYLINKQITQRWATLVTHTLNQEPYTQYYTYKGPYRLPIKPLIGIKAPALAFEIGLQKNQDWVRAVDATVAALAPLITECQ